MSKLVQVETAEQVEQARELFREYQAWLGVDLCFQNFEKELAELPGKYAPPDGRLLLASSGERLAGCVCLRRLDAETCEMKRLFVRPGFRGQKIGKALTDTIIEEARRAGYRRIRLDTLPDKMERAVAVYRSLGFKEIEPYYHNPFEGTLYMELTL
jgi:putative acetyltransferase